MLVKLGGATGGLKEYLEEGRMAGREQTRDELDQRIPLAGDLDYFESVVDSMATTGNKYLHVTLSFAEDKITPELMHKTVEEFIGFAMCAYDPDEYTYYAEAHKPRIKSYVGKMDGELVIRKPHIHLAIPRTNLLTGERLAPLGFEEHNLKYIDAWQEDFNARYGLISPKDSPRIDGKNLAELLSRYGRREWVGQNHQELKAQLLGDIFACNIKTYADLKTRLGTIGKVTIGKSVVFGEYLKVTPPGQSKAIRLEGVGFRPDFLAKSPAEREAIAKAAATVAYTEAQQARKAPARAISLLAEWRQIRAREIKYLKTASRFYKDTYQPASAAEKATLLKSAESNYATKHRSIKHVHSPSQTRFNPPPTRRDRLHHLSELDVVHVTGRSEMLLPSDVSTDLDYPQANANHGLRRPNNEPRPLRISPQQSSVVGGLRVELAERSERNKAQNEFSEIRLKLDANRLLAHLSHTHGLNPAKYSVEKTADGSDRVRAGTRAFTVSDFLAKEMALPWRESAPILKLVYSQQLHRDVPHIRDTVQAYAWRQFREVFDSKKAAQIAAMAELVSVVKIRRAALSTQLNTESISRKNALKGRSPEEKKAANSIAKMQAAAARAELATNILKERLTLRNSVSSMMEAYTDYLRDLANNGDEQALIALRKRETIPKKGGVDDAGIIVTKATDSLVTKATDSLVTKATDSLVTKGISDAKLFRSFYEDYRVDRAGNVEYRLDGKAVLRDEGQHLAVLDQHNPEVIAVALKIGAEKFGGKLELTGSVEFQHLVVAIAVNKGIAVTFLDPNLDKLRLQLTAERDAMKQQSGTKKLPVPAAMEKLQPSQALPSPAVAPASPLETEKLRALDVVSAARTFGIAVDSNKVESLLNGEKQVAGPFIGKVVAVDLLHGLVYQSLGRGVGIVHLAASLSRIPNIGEITTIQFNMDGKGIVKDLRPVKDRGHGH